jgi:phytoene synthase
MPEPARGTAVNMSSLAQASNHGLPHSDVLLQQAYSENFTVASRLLPRRIRRHIMAVYGYARLVDFAGDEVSPPREPVLDLLEAELKRVYHGTPRLPLLRALVPTVRECGIPQALLARLIWANRQDQRIRRYRTFDELAEYCEHSANPIGELVLRIFGSAEPELVALSDRVCTGLQILEHCQDIKEDYARGRIYLPTEDLERLGCVEEDLGQQTASPNVQALIWFEVDRARQLLADGLPLVARLRGLPRVAVSGYLAGGRATVHAFAGADHDSLGRRVEPSRGRTFTEWARLWTMPQRTPTGDRVRSAYEHCERITRSQAKNFSYGISLLPPPKRRALSAVYAFARRVDDIGDGTLPEEDKLRLLDQARGDLARLTVDSPDPVLVGLADAAHQKALPCEAFEELIDGCEADVRGRRYETFDELVGYCRYVAGSIGRLSLGVFGTAEQNQPSAVRHADALGVALQLTNILRDVLEDRRNGRIYLPTDDLFRFGVTLELTSDGELADEPQSLVELVRYQARRAQEYYDEGMKLLPLLDRRSRACCAAMAGIYHQLLCRIEHDPATAAGTRMALPTPQKALIAARALVGGAP